MSAVLPRRLDTVVIGSGAAVLFFSLAITWSVGAWMVWAGTLTHEVDAGIEPEPTLSFLSLAAVVLLTALVIAGVGSSLAALLIGAPLALVADVILTRSSSPIAHAVGAFTAGALTGTAACALLISPATESLHWMIAMLIPVSAVSATVGWLTAWLISRRPPVRDLSHGRMG